MQLSGDYAMRVLRGFRPGLPPEAARGIVHVFAPHAESGARVASAA